MDLTKAKATTTKWLFRLLLGGVLLTLVGTTIYVFFTLNYSYSTGERVGVVQKMSKKGWLCKTNEGDLAIVTTSSAQQPQIFSFTVRDDKVMQDIDGFAGHKVVLTYDEHRGIPSSCFGETTYFVTGVKKAD